MSKAALLLMFALSGTQALAAQSSGASPVPPARYVQQVAPAPPGSSQVVANTEVHAVLETPLSNRTSQPGDRFIATITDPVRATNGMIVIPAGSRLEGEVVAIIPNVTIQIMWAPQVDFLLIVEKLS